MYRHHQLNYESNQNVQIEGFNLANTGIQQCQYVYQPVMATSPMITQATQTSNQPANLVHNGSFTYLAAPNPTYYATSTSNAHFEPLSTYEPSSHYEPHSHYDIDPCSYADPHQHIDMNYQQYEPKQVIDPNAPYMVRIQSNQQALSNLPLPPPPSSLPQVIPQRDPPSQPMFSICHNSVDNQTGSNKNIMMPSIVFHIDCTAQPPVVSHQEASSFTNTSAISLNNNHLNSTSNNQISIPIELTMAYSSNVDSNIPANSQTETFVDDASKSKFSQGFSSRSTFTDLEDLTMPDSEYVAEYYHIPTFDLKTFNFKLQSLEAENGERISSINSNGRLVTFLDDSLRTVYDLFMHGWKVSNNGRYLGWRSTPEEPYKWIDYRDADDIIQAIGSGFMELGLEPGKAEKIGIFARNRPEWTLIDLACSAYSFISVPIFDTIGQLGIDVILNQTKMRLVICDDPEKALKLMKFQSDLKVIVILENVISHEASMKANERNIKLIKFKKFKRIGQKNIKQPIPPNSNDVYTICYTSGTTAMPKGAIMTHGNILSVVSSLLVMFRDVGLAYGKETHFSYLPMAHMFERIAQALMLGLGGSIGFYQGDSRRIQDDVIQLKPSIFCSVPRLLTKFYVEITQSIASSSVEKQQKFEAAYIQKEADLSRGIINHRNPTDQAFKEIREIFGGKLKLFFIGAAPICPEIVKFFKIVCGCHVMEGYGATETSGVASLQFPGDSRSGNAGPPLPCSILKLEDIPELSLSVKRDKKGEIMVYGPNVFKGYYKDEEKTREVLDSNGWFRTGDVGAFDETGCIQVIDRIKHVFRLQSGELIAPGILENFYLRSDLITQIFIYGDGLKSCLVAIAVPKEAIFIAMAKKNNMEVDFKSMCLNPSIRQAILSDLNRIAIDAGLKPHERIKDVYLHSEMFSVENNLLTATMKLKRNEIKNYFRKEIDTMYRRLE